ncbi:MAG: hypothetical protein Q8P52_01840 [bacterium]|nr:hypothetical protein [bacterium]
MYNKEENLKHWMSVVEWVYKNPSKDSKPQAIFVHAWPDLLLKTLKFVAEIYEELEEKPLIILNSIDYFGSSPSGFEYCREALTERFKIPAGSIKAIPPAKQTLEEARGFIKVAKDESIARAIMTSTPQHLLRAFLTDLAVLAKEKPDLKLYPAVISKDSYSWFGSYKAKSLFGGEDEKAIRLGRFASEIIRILNYQNKMAQGEGDYMVADIEDAVSYIKKLQL